jgi:hypothetical protein
MTAKERIKFLLKCKAIRKFINDNPGKTAFQIEKEFPDAKKCLERLVAIDLVWEDPEKVTKCQIHPAHYYVIKAGANENTATVFGKDRALF